MSINTRLRDEREKLAISQEAMGEIGGVKKLAQINYEKGDRSPDANYLAAIAAAGADVLYILTGERTGPAPVVLSAEEQTMVAYMREASPALRKAALGVLLSGSTGGGNTNVVNRSLFSGVFNRGK